MDWSHATVDEIDRGFDHFGSLFAASAAELCELIDAADVAQSWMRDGARTLSEWVALRLRVRPESASRLVRVARRLTDLPVLSERFAAGDLSLDQVDAISKMATADTEETLIEEALSLSNHELDRRARRTNPPTAEEAAEADWLRGAWIQRRLDEAGGRLTAELANAELELVETRLRHRADRYGPNPDTGLFDPYSQRLADALVETCATSGDENTSVPPQVTVYAELDALTTETEGVIGVGRKRRTIPGWLRRLVHHRDGGQCQWVGCEETGWLQVHHIIHWSLGGPTDLDNLILLCGFHHRFLHEKGWHITRDAGGRFQFRRPDWRLYPPPKPPLEPRLAALVGRSP